VALPAAALITPGVWYEIAVDSYATPNGVDADDVFPERVKLDSVPFARQAAEAGHIDAAAVGLGTVDDTELDALDGVTGPVQTQLGAKADADDVYTKTEVDDSQGLQDDAIAAITFGVPGEGESFVVVEVTDNAVTNGLNLLAAYATASGTFTNCKGTSFAFGGGGGTASGTFTNCTGSFRDFGGAGGSTLGGKFYGCRMTSTSWGGTMRGRMDGCHWGTGVTCGAEARLYNSTFLGNVDLDGSTAGIAHCNVNDSILDAGSASFNFGNLCDADVE